MRRIVIAILTFAIAFGLAGCAAYYSIFGLAHMFAGAWQAVIIMASFLEAGKLLVATLLHSGMNDRFTKFIKIYLNIALVGLMFVTSLGIYGFLTNAYQTTANKMSVIDGNISVLENKKIVFENNIKRLNDQIDSKTKRIDQITIIRSQQETRLDSLYNKGWYSAAKRTEKIINDANDDANALIGEIDVLMVNIGSNNDSISNIDMDMLSLSTDSDVAAEIGPLKYISSLLDISMDRIINYYILLFIFLFDPLAVMLVIVFNKLIGKNTGDKKEYELKKSEGEFINNIVEEDIVEEEVVDKNITPKKPVENISKIMVPPPVEDYPYIDDRIVDTNPTSGMDSKNDDDGRGLMIDY